MNNIPDNIQFAQPQNATLVTQEVRTQKVAGLGFTKPGTVYEIDPVKQTVRATLIGLQRPRLLIMGGTAPTPYKDGHTEQDRRAALLAALAIPTSAIPVSPAPPTK